MTPQEIFDKSVGGIITQGGPAYAPNKGCRYRLGDLKCAAGQLIADEDYTERLEGRASFADELRQVLPQDHIILIGDLQRAHDSSATGQRDFFEQFRHKAKNIACNYGLSTAILENPQ